jgi:hypothetical protein
MFSILWQTNSVDGPVLISIYIRNLNIYQRLFRPKLKSCLTDSQQALLLKVIGDLLDALLNRLAVVDNVDLRVLGSLVRRADTSELLDLTGTSLLVQALGVTLLSDLHRDVDVDLDEGKGDVVGAGGNLLVQLTSAVTVRPER